MFTVDPSDVFSSIRRGLRWGIFEARYALLLHGATIQSYGEGNRSERQIPAHSGG